MNRKQKIKDLESQITYFKKEADKHLDAITEFHRKIKIEADEMDKMVLYKRALERHVRFIIEGLERD
jgi:hypothetical protein